MESGRGGNDRPHTSAGLVPAARYGRKSTDNQEYSVELQFDAIDVYAARRGMEIVRTYVDDGISGLTFEGRDALQQLIDDVGSGNAGFEVILVYDISRWGRYQDADESAYYEYICKRAGVSVHYCAEQFENDGSSFSTIVKNIKRAQAGDYSRDLSVKVFAGQSRLIKLGYRQGASPGYGLRRLLVDHNGIAKQILAPGEWKSIQTDRVILAHGPPDETEIVRWIFRTFVKRKKPEAEIARLLNEQGVTRAKGGLWEYRHIRRVLTNENYIGDVVWNRQSCKLKQKLVDNDPEQWIRAEGVLDPIVERSIFDAAQAIIRDRLPGLSLEEKIKPLRRLFRKHGTLSAHLINRTPGVPSASSYHRWFGGLVRAYELVGYTARSRCRDGRLRRSLHGTTLRLRNEELLEMLVRVYQTHGYLTRRIIDETEGIPSAGTYSRRFGSLERAYELIGLPWNLPNRPPRKPHRSTLSLSDQQLLEILRLLLRIHGRLTRKIINDTQGVPCVATYQRRFGGVLPAYELIGYTAEGRGAGGLSNRTKSISDDVLLADLRQLLKERGRLTARMIDAVEGVPASGTYRRRFGSLARAYRLIGYQP